MSDVTISGRKFRWVSPALAARWDGNHVPGLIDAFPATIDHIPEQLIAVTGAGLLLIGDQGSVGVPWTELISIETRTITHAGGTVTFRLADGGDWADLDSLVEESRAATAGQGAGLPVAGPAHVDLGDGRLAVDLGVGGVHAEGEHLIVRASGASAQTGFTARLPLLALTDLTPGSETAQDPSLRPPNTVARITVWDGPTLVLRGGDTVEAITAQREALVEAAQRVAWNELVFPMSAARAEAVRRHLSGGDVPMDLPGLTALFRAEFATPLDALPAQFLSLWRATKPDIGPVVAAPQAAGGTYLILGRSGVALSGAAEQIAWARYTDLELPAGGVSGSSVTLVLRTRDGVMLSLTIFDAHDPGLGQIVRHLHRRVLDAQLADLPADPISRLEWAQDRHDNGAFDEATLALAVAQVLTPQFGREFTETPTPYPPTRATATPRPMPPPQAPLPPPTPAPAPAPRPAMTARQVRGVAMVAGLAARALTDDE